MGPFTASGNADFSSPAEAGTAAPDDAGAAPLPRVFVGLAALTGSSGWRSAAAFFGAGDFDLFRTFLGGRPGPLFLATTSSSDGGGEVFALEGGLPGPLLTTTSDSAGGVFGLEGGLPGPLLTTTSVVEPEGDRFLVGRGDSDSSPSGCFRGLPRFLGGGDVTTGGGGDLFLGGRPRLRGGCASVESVVVSGRGCFRGLPGPRFAGDTDAAVAVGDSCLVDLGGGGEMTGIVFRPEIRVPTAGAFCCFVFAGLLVPRVPTLGNVLFSIARHDGQNQPDDGTAFRGGSRQKM
jgi:hypothetical protein